MRPSAHGLAPLPTEHLSEARVDLVLRELGFEARELDDLAEPAARMVPQVRQEGSRFHPTWRVAGTEVYAYDWRRYHGGGEP